MLGHAGSDDFSVEGVERGKQRGGAIALVIAINFLRVHKAYKAMNIMRNVYCGVVGSIMALVLTSCTPGEDWKYIATSSTRSATSYQQWETYYDKNSIERTTSGMVKVWLKHMPRINREEVIEIHEYEQRQLDVIKGMHSFIQRIDLINQP